MMKILLSPQMAWATGHFVLKSVAQVSKQAYNRAIERTKPTPVVVGAIWRVGLGGWPPPPSQEFGLEPFALMAGGSFCLEPWSAIVNIAMLTTQSPLFDDVIDLQTLEAHLWKSTNILRGLVDTADFKT